jgi:flagellar hook-basal body complex protein FliE
MTLLVPIVANAAASLVGAAATTLAQTAQTSATPESAGVGFGEVLKKLASDSVDAVKAGEAAAIGGVQGQLPTHMVVDMVMSAERDLQTIIALRDKAVNAFQEISRMSI